jgi:hypothetical protein
MWDGRGEEVWGFDIGLGLVGLEHIKSFTLKYQIRP